MLSFALFLLGVTKALAASSVGRSFTYQGRLGSGGQSASGLYDFQFTLDDALTNGNVVAGPILSTNLAVTNGLFLASLDSGSNAFNGTALWLELEVRTNGDTAFTTLSPRQALAPAPYAQYALYSGSALPQTSGTYTGAVSFGNPSNSFSGSFSGNGAGLTNIPIASGSIGNIQLNLSYAEMIAAGTSDSVDQRLRFGWTNTFAALKNTNQPWRVEFTGDGWTEDSVIQTFATNLMTHFGFARCGHLGLGGLWGFYPYGNDNGALTTVDDSLWHGYMVRLPANGVYCTWSFANWAVQWTNMPGFKGFPPNQINVLYTASSTNGSFKVQYATNGGGFQWWDSAYYDLPSSACNCSNSSTLGGVFSIPCSLAGPASIQVVSTGTSNVTILGVEEINSRASGVILSTRYCHQATSMNAYIQADANIVYPIFKTLNPTLLLMIHGTQENPQGFYDYVKAMRLLNADVVSMQVQTELYSQPIVTDKQAAASRGIPYFDGVGATEAAFGGYTNGVALGLYPAGDSHMTLAGYKVEGDLLWSWMGLANYSPDYFSASSGTGVTTNVSISGSATLFITNGQIGKITQP